jgi:N-hydroxyarylamine O-acetyltransferase
MTAQNFDLQKYLKRIGFEGEAKADLPTLFGLMRSQLQSVPFENITVQKGQTPSLIPEDIVEKVVNNGMGGYCYEINGLFAIALTALGFEWYFAAARPMFYPAKRPKTHMVVIVRLLGEEWLCDTGFGGYGLREPVALAEDVEFVQDGDKFRIEQNEDGEYVLSSLASGEWQKQYGFATSPQEWIEFALANHFNATHPDTIFTQKKLAIMQTKTGRKILVDDTLKLIENGELKEQNIPYADALKEHFGIVL